MEDYNQYRYRINDPDKVTEEPKTEDIQEQPAQAETVRPERVQTGETRTETVRSNGVRTEKSTWSPYPDPDKQKKEKKTRDGKGRFGINLLKCAAFAVVFGLVAGGLFHAVNPSLRSAQASIPVTKTIDGEEEQEELITQDASEAEDSTDAEPGKATASVKTSSGDVSEVVENVMPSIVSITTIGLTEYYDFFGTANQYESEGSGSGIIVADDDDYLYIATNNHVVEGANSLTVCFSDDETVEGTVKGTQAGADLAVVTVEKKALKDSTKKAVRVATLGNSSHIKVGEQAIAIGNALGYGQSVTTGVISALDRQVTAQDSSGKSVTNTLIQTDAAINPGNSGGALLNGSGEVIGINSVKFTDTSVEGMGYAIPISTAEPIINNLIKREAVAEEQQAYLGISGVDVTSSVSATYDLPEGIYIAHVEPGTAAEKAGLKKGDVIIKIDDREVYTMEELKDEMSYYASGEKAKITFQRAESGEYEEKSVTVIFGKWEEGAREE